MGLMLHLIAAGSVLVLTFGVAFHSNDLELRVRGMAHALHHNRKRTLISLQAQLGDTFLSSKHQDYQAAIAEPSSAKRA
ncbi:hypothetical protein DES40_1333 [Litorimonas taeanensis]|uniref:Uncharacterized protein n=1 Tax=Litorimonas taeanensis TaxID=568099 RepID=A0A420WLV2_9PROT|nr:hypothetical protein DES40_1333 [Litorimonas taeanensis]